MDSFLLILQSWSVVFLNIIMDFIMTFNLLQFILIEAQVAHLWSVTAPPRRLLSPCDMTLVITGSLLAIWYDKMSWIHLVHFPHQTPNQPVLQEVAVSFSGKQYFKSKIWLLGLLISTRLVIVTRSFKCSEVISNSNTDDGIFTLALLYCIYISFPPYW